MNQPENQDKQLIGLAAVFISFFFVEMKNYDSRDCCIARAFSRASRRAHFWWGQENIWKKFDKNEISRKNLTPSLGHVTLGEEKQDLWKQVKHVSQTAVFSKSNGKIRSSELHISQ